MNDKNYNAPAKKGGIRLLTLLMVFVIAVTAVVNSICVYNVLGGDPQDNLNATGLSSEQATIKEKYDSKIKQTKAEMQNGISTFTSAGPAAGGTDDFKIESYYDCYDALTASGISSDDFSYTRTVSNDCFDVYDMQQTYSGVEVYGYVMKVTADKDGNLLYVNGAKADVNGFDVYADYYEDDCLDTLKDYLIDEYEFYENEVNDSDIVNITSGGKKIFIMEDEPYLGYMFTVVSSVKDLEMFREIIVDAKANEVISDQSLLFDPLTTVEYDGQNGKRKIDVYESYDDDGDTYVMFDDERRLRAYMNQANSSWDNFLSWHKKNEAPSQSAVDTYANLQAIYDAYEKLFGLKGLYDGYINIYIDYTGMVDNAAMARTGGKGSSDEQRYVLIGSKGDMEYTCGYYGDVIAHEYTHGVVDSKSNLNEFTVPEGKDSYNTPQMGINEAFADVLGDIMEDYIDDKKFNGTNDWKMADGILSGSPIRDLGDVDNSGEGGTHLKSFRDFKNDYSIDGHNSSTIVSHAAYLMADNEYNWLSTDQIANLFYYTIPQMTSSTNFQYLRYLLENQAVLMNRDYHNGTQKYSKSDITDEDLETVMDALDAVYLPRINYSKEFDYTYSITPDCELTVYDRNFNEFKNYNICIQRMSDGEVVLDEDSKKATYKLDGIHPGIYRLIITNLENEKQTCVSKLWINDNNDEVYAADDPDRYQDEEVIWTNFNATEREVVLVLDNSGSMSGTPLTETKASAKKFLNYVFGENPNITVSLVTYSDDATTRISASNNENEIIAAIDSIYADSMTNTYDGLNTAYSILKDSDLEKRMIILMSDGLPNEGPYDGNYDYHSPIIDLASDIKADDILIYTLGFYHSLYDEDRASCQSLMEAVASPGYAYDVADSDELAFAFEDMADIVTGDYAILIRIACPVDVTVSYNGEVLSSDEDSRNTRASFGSLSFEGDDDEVKVLRLSNEANYEIYLNGTGSGTMDYTISFADENGEYSDVRTFKKVPISRETLISTNTNSQGHTSLAVDKNGDGKIDSTYTAGHNRKGKVKDFNIWLYVAIGSGALLLVLIAVETVLIIKRAKKNKICRSCGQQISKETVFCRTCGARVQRVPLLLPQRDPANRQSPTAVVAKLVVMGICIMSTVCVIAVYRSSATTVYNQIRNQEVMMAKTVYEEHVEGKGLPEKYLSFVTEHYLKKVEKARQQGKFADGTAETVYTAVSEMELGGAASKAEDYMESITSNDEKA